MTRLKLILAGAAAILAMPAQAQLAVDVTDESAADMVIAVPAMPTPESASTPAGTTDALGRQVAEVIAGDLTRSGLFRPLGPGAVRAITFPEVTAPAFDYWPGTGAVALVQGFVRANSDGKLTVGCYLYDVALKSELTRQGYVVEPRDWRRAAHKCADAIYARLSGESPFFDSRIAYIAESGPKDKRVKRLAIMDSDGANHRFLTNGQSVVLTPRFSPDYKQIVYLSYLENKPRIYIYDIGTGRQRLVTESVNQTFAPRFSPDGRFILYSMSVNGNMDIYRISASGGTPQRLTNSPGIDIGGSYSPDGSRIVFESDRSGSQQLYVMNADGSNQRRISFGGGSYATPEWSPRGDLIAFTRVGSFRIGVMTPDGSGERLLTNSWQDESPSWSPNGRVIQFFRTSQGRGGKSSVWQVDLTGTNERRIPTPLDGSDPAWGPLLP
ncbi:Tol-Pal system beta propeller repeat protein TolB [Sphingosinicella sp. LY1275]|uniref:Tol-Pal system beta propeller repeat protein TolB n=1 Tax=Sphingosinicella sp. LY1275 TaxID=3095379 RepID=UPI002ADEDA80|nr:Tol-Pal system beta propeller repeat protein TolB [Sphingosinicella sp. LY1275]MEA1014587.1 Tol-Pal system beta propeller repeat protein TolB [Sphingosinicella sp. LY1275]